eukprot:1161525-Pelagomonas_calceolata.AAC.6
MIGSLQVLSGRLFRHTCPPQPHQNPSCFPDFLREDFPVRRVFEQKDRLQEPRAQSMCIMHSLDGDAFCQVKGHELCRTQPGEDA